MLVLDHTSANYLVLDHSAANWLVLVTTVQAVGGSFLSEAYAAFVPGAASAAAFVLTVTGAAYVPGTVSATAYTLTDN